MSKAKRRDEKYDSSFLFPPKYGLYIAASEYNKINDKEIQAIYGCVTTGELWQFAQLKEDQIIIDKEKYFIESPEIILGVLQYIINSLDNHSLEG